MGIGKIPVELSSASTGFPVLTDLGKRVEVLRIRRALSKQILARHVGVSRQQLWRVMTGKSELMPSLCARLADALGVSPAELEVGGSPAPSSARADGTSNVRLESYIANANAIAETLETLPADDRGRSLKRVLLNAIEDQAIACGHPLDAGFFDLRRRVVAGEL